MSSRDVSLTGIPHMGKATAIGALLGAFAVTVPLSAVLILLGGGAMSILAGVHVGFFGGMGYGGMLGAVIHADRFERAAKSAAATTTVITSHATRSVRPAHRRAL